MLNLDDGELVLEQEKSALKRSLSMDDEYYHDKASTLPSGRMKNNKEVGFPIVEKYQADLYEISINRNYEIITHILNSKICSDV